MSEADDRTLGRASQEPTLARTSTSPAAMAGRVLPVIPGYTVTRLLGEGGMGAVYEAQQESPRRTVALKLVRAGVLTSALMRRFAFEVEVLGRLEHPGIARIYEAGTANLGAGEQPFFAMEFVRGRTLLEDARGRKLSTRQRLELMTRVCQAVHYAHQKGVVHRDLKPGNILVDETGQPKVLDFGVARATDGDVQTATMQTEVGQLVGTLPYMSPEQVGGDTRQIDIRSDVYALGVIAYELLCGRRPYHLENRMIHEAVRIIRDDEPTPLSSIDRSLRGDIQTIVAKALEKEKERRYASASDMASDIERYLSDEPISARPAGAVYRLSKFARRNKVLVAGVLAVFLALVLGVIGTSLGMVRAQRLYRDSQYELYLGLVTLADSQVTAGRCDEGLETLRKCPPELRGWEWRRLRRAADASLQTFINPLLFPHGLSPDGRFVLGDTDEGYVVAEVATRRIQATLEQTTTDKQSISASSWSADGRRIAVASYQRDVGLWDTQTGKLLHRLDGDLSRATRVACSPAGDLVAVYDDREEVAGVWDAQTGAKLATLPHDEVDKRMYVHQAMAFSPDGQTLVTAEAAGKDYCLKRWEARTGRLLQRATTDFQTMAGTVLTWSPDGRLLAVGGSNRVVYVWDAANFNLLGRLGPEENDISAIAWSADSSRFLVGTRGGVVRVLDAKTGSTTLTVRGPGGGIQSLALSDDGQRILALSVDQAVRVWDARRDHVTQHLQPSGNYPAFWTSDEQAVVSAYLGNNVEGQWRYTPTVARWEPSTGSMPRTIFGVGGSVMGTIALHPSEPWLAMVIEEDQRQPDSQQVVIVDLDGKSRRLEIPRPGARVRTLAWSQDGERLGVGDENNLLTLYDASSGAVVNSITGPGQMVAAAAWSPDGRRLAVGGYGGRQARIVDAVNGEPIGTLHIGSSGVDQIAWSPDGQFLATAEGSFESVRIWDARTFKPVRSVPCHASRIAWSPDGLRLALAIGDDLTIADPWTGRPVLTLHGNHGFAASLAWSRDSATLLTSFQGHSVDEPAIRLWFAHDVGP